ncbi:MAG: hypothetical protein HW419_4513, partial [Deltaproteobacteria bacterium]|nr:hypothetical protein [Deltaproteobacteria bacterium]
MLTIGNDKTCCGLYRPCLTICGKKTNKKAK